MRAVGTAEIIAVGSELLTPHRIDTNSLYLTSQLNALGIDVRTKSVVGDDRLDLAERVRQALGRADVVITTGGLGPTEDDITREAVASMLGVPLDEDAALVAAIEERFARRGLRMPVINRRQAQRPRGATLLPNPNGTAPGLWIDVAERILVLLPGPPRELHVIFETLVAPRLRERTGGVPLRRRVIKVTGRPESHVDEVAQPIYATFLTKPMRIDTTILASPGQIELHLSARATDVDDVDRALEAAVEELAAALGASVFSVDGRALEEVVGEQFLGRGWRVAVAESCTGGLLLGRLTDVPGSSAWVVGGVVAYANEVKIRDLDVPQAVLDEHGAVSEPVARAMAEGVRARLGADVGVAITGIAGPGGGSPAKPVGTVVIAVAASQTVARTFRFQGDRAMVRTQSVMAALDMVRRETTPGVVLRKT